MKLGRKSEPMIAEMVEEKLGGKVARDGLVRFHKDYDYLATNLDGIYYDEDGNVVWTNGITTVKKGDIEK